MCLRALNDHTNMTESESESESFSGLITSSGPDIITVGDDTGFPEVILLPFCFDVEIVVTVYCISIISLWQARIKEF